MCNFSDKKLIFSGSLLFIITKLQLCLYCEILSYEFRTYGERYYSISEDVWEVATWWFWCWNILKLKKEHWFASRLILWALFPRSRHRQINYSDLCKAAKRDWSNVLFFSFLAVCCLLSSWQFSFSFRPSPLWNLFLRCLLLSFISWVFNLFIPYAAAGCWKEELLHLSTFCWY